MRTVDLNGVRTWYDVRGSGEPLVLFHPGGVDTRAFEYGDHLERLSSQYRVYVYDRRGHGRTPDAGSLTFDDMTSDAVAFMEAVVGEPAHFVGCSDGATVALNTALRSPELARDLVFICGVWHKDGWKPGSLELDDESAAFLGDTYGEVSPDGRDHYPVVAAKLYQAHLDGPTVTTADLAASNVRTLVMVADDDEVILEHAVEMYRAMPSAELAVVPGTSHGLMVEKPLLIHTLITDFLTTEKPQVIAPVDRA